jgi:Reverse transcriptase (RNA-dependent DNA polymerase).
MGTSISGIIADISLQYCEQLILKHTNKTKTITYYNRYADDILIIIDSTITSEEYITSMMKNIHSNLSFTFTWEENNCTNFLDSCFVRKKD